MFHKLRSFFRFYSFIRKDPRVPAKAKWLPWIALAYLILPFDLAPDLIPLIGQLDDVAVIITFLWIAINAINDKIYKEYNAKEKKDAIDVQTL